MRTCRFDHMYDNFKMVVKYFKRMPATPSLPTKLDSLSEAQLQKVNEHIWKTVGDGAISCGTLNKQCLHQYNKYSAKERADIGKYAAENGATNACKNFTMIHTRQNCTRIHSAKIEITVPGCTRNKD